MGQIAQQIAGSQAQGALPSATVTNPRDHKNVSAVTKRSGKPLEVSKQKLEEEDPLLEVDLEIKENHTTFEEKVTQKHVEKEKPAELKTTIKLPYPTRQKKRAKMRKYLRSS